MNVSLNDWWTESNDSALQIWLICSYGVEIYPMDPIMARWESTDLLSLSEDGNTLTPDNKFVLSAVDNFVASDSDTST